jgi:hypothetical protein
MKSTTVLLAGAALLVLAQTAQARGHDHHHLSHRGPANIFTAIFDLFDPHHRHFSTREATTHRHTVFVHRATYRRHHFAFYHRAVFHRHHLAFRHRVTTPHHQVASNHRATGRFHRLSFNQTAKPYLGEHYALRRRSRYWAWRRYAHPAQSSYSGGFGARPAAWCGWAMRHFVSRDPGPTYNLARNWAHWGHAGAPGVGAIVVWPHHVGKIVGREGKLWVVKSGNDGHMIRSRPRSIAAAIAIRWDGGRAGPTAARQTVRVPAAARQTERAVLYPDDRIAGAGAGDARLLQ